MLYLFLCSFNYFGVRVCVREGVYMYIVDFLLHLPGSAVELEKLEEKSSG